jgi:hypothetical protein
MNKKYRLEKFDHIETELNDNDYNKLKIGDMVELCVVQLSRIDTIYFEIIKIDRYRYGGIHKPRKFHGQICCDYWQHLRFIDCGICDKIITFQKNNIFDIPSFNFTNYLKQNTKERVDLYRKQLMKDDNKRSEIEYYKSIECGKELSSLIKNLSERYKIPYNKCKKIATLIHDDDYNNVLNRFMSGNLSIKAIERELQKYILEDKKVGCDC